MIGEAIICQVPDQPRTVSGQNPADSGFDWRPPVAAQGSTYRRNGLLAWLGVGLLVFSAWRISSFGLRLSGVESIELYLAVVGVIVGAGLIAWFWIHRLRLQLLRSRELASELREMHSRLRQRSRELEQQSRTDNLTGVGNSLLMSETLEFEVHRSDRYGDPLSMALVEIGGLRRLHVRMGRHAVDDTLRQAALRVQDCVESSDWVFRWGDGEFVVVWLNTDSLKAEERAMSMYRTLREGCIRDGQDLPVSVGSTTYARNEGIDRFLARLDLAKKDLTRGGVCNLPSDQSEMEQTSEI